MECFGHLVSKGIPPSDFWDMTLAEIICAGKAINRNEKNELQVNASMLWQTANLVGLRIGSLLDKKMKFPDLKTAFPIFDAEEPDRPQWMVIRDRMNSRAAEINRLKSQS